MSGKGDSSVPYIFGKMQNNFQRNFFGRPVARGRNFHLKNFTSHPEIFEVFEFQGWNDFLLISDDIYRGLVPVFYSTLAPTDEGNTSL